MRSFRVPLALAVSGSMLGLAACATGGGRSPPPPPPVRPAAFIPLGLGAAYVSGDVIGGRKARAAKMKAAKIRPLSGAAGADYMIRADRELRAQTAGIGVDIIRVGDGILIRIPAALTFDSNSTAIRPQFDATLNEVARTLKVYNQTYVDVYAHTDTSGSPQYNASLSQKRASAVAAFLGSHGVTKGRIASKGLGETVPLYPLEQSESQRAANRRVEIRLVAYRG
jgi:outer membrane protein OmpA-like peptidoglycan-associated protein